MPNHVPTACPNKNPYLQENIRASSLIFIILTSLRGYKYFVTTTYRITTVICNTMEHIILCLLLVFVDELSVIRKLNNIKSYLYAK